jgi:hypothetical protein
MAKSDAINSSSIHLCEWRRQRITDHLWADCMCQQSLPLAPFTYMNSSVSALQINRVADCMRRAILATGSIHLREWRRQRITDQPCG